MSRCGRPVLVLAPGCVHTHKSEKPLFWFDSARLPKVVWLAGGGGGGGGGWLREITQTRFRRGVLASRNPARMSHRRPIVPPERLDGFRRCRRVGFVGDPRRGGAG